MTITEVRFRPAPKVVDSDLIGWASCVIDGSIFLNNILVKRGRTGIYLHYPKSGERRIFNPINAETESAIRAAVVAAVEGVDRAEA